MTNTAFPVLCGGTFFTQILQSRKPTASRRQRTKGISDIFREPDVLFGLVKMVLPDYIKPAGDTFKTYTTKYKKCAEYTPDDLKFENESVVSAFLTRLEKEYAAEINKAAAFTKQFIDISTTTQNHVFLVKRLIELIRDDESLPTTVTFTIGRDNASITKNEIADVTEVYLPAFLLSVWKFIVTKRKDNSIGAATIASWFPEGTGRYKGISGSTIKQEIKVYCDPLDTIEATTEMNEDDWPKAEVNSTEKSTPTKNPHAGTSAAEKSLLGLFEDAIDEFDIAEFVDSDYTAMQLRMDLAFAVDAFVATVRYHLKSFRRQQDDVFKNVMLFVNAVEQYSAFLSMRMFCGDGDGRFSRWMWNNTTEDVEVAWKYRNNINLLYGLISGGGTLSVYGYSTPETADEAESNGSKVNAAKSAAANYQVLNNPNGVNQQGNIQIENQEISHDYYNLFVIGDEIKNNRFTMPKDRSLRSNSDKVKKFADLTHEAIAQIKTFPSLFMNENTEYGGRTSPEQEAYYGFVTDLRVQENGIIKVRFRCDAKINQQQLNDIVRMLDIHEGSGIMELNHTHWTIKNVDLIEELTEAELLPKESTGGDTPMKIYHDEPRCFSQTGDRNTLIAHADSVVMHGAAISSAEEFYRDILIYLESKRVLYNPGEVEQREHCIQSVLDMKNTLSKSVMDKRLSANELQPIRTMVSACNDYLNKVGKADGQVFVITAQSGCDWFDNSPNGSLGKLRGSFRSVIKGLENEYGLHYGKDI